MEILLRNCRASAAGRQIAMPPGEYLQFAMLTGENDWRRCDLPEQRLNSRLRLFT
jgi:hypothetical protein